MPRTPRGGPVGRPRKATKNKAVTLLLSDEALEMLAEIGCEFNLSRNKAAEHMIRGYHATWSEKVEAQTEVAMLLLEASQRPSEFNL